MTAITQKIPNFIGGISQQPNELQPNGTLKDCLNAIPDVKGVVAKRPGTKFEGALTNVDDGKWYHYFRDSDESYIMRIRKNGVLDVWTTAGQPLPVSYTNTPINALDETITGLPTPETPAEGTQAQYPDCDLEAFQSALDDVRGAAGILNFQKSQIQEKNVEAAKLQAEVDGTFTYKLLDKTLVIGQAQLADGTVFLEQGKPAEQTGYTTTAVYRETADIVIRSRSDNAIGYVDKLYPNARLYAWKTVRDAAQAELDAVNAEIAVLEAGIFPLIEDLQDARAIWEPLASDCGVYENPFGRGSATYSGAVPDPIEYFIHENDEDIQFTTINDYTFVTNRTIIPRMTGGGNPNYNPNSESFVNVDLLATDKPYTLFFDLINEETTTDFTKATRVSISPSSWEDGSDTCEAAGSQKLTATDGTRTMEVIVTTVGSQYLKEFNAHSGVTNYDCRYQTQVRLVSSGSGWEVGDTASVTMNGKGYTITVQSVSTQSVGAEIIVETAAINTLDSALLLNNMVSNIEAQTDFTARVVGNGVFITDPSGTKPFKVTTPDGGYMTTINNQVNNVADLPDQCVDGYTIKVVNSFIEEDDYWVVFRTELKNTDATGDERPAGAGVWEETVDPTVLTDIDYESMPYQIRRLPNLTFEISPIRWMSREVGDNITNPIPSFIGNPINKMVFFRNRMALLAGENIVFSRANEYFNYWASTALVVTDSDPVDLNVSSTFPAILFDALDTAAGLLLFSENQQHLVVTDNTDIFGPETAVVKSVGTYKYNPKTAPIDMGQTVGFLNDAGYRSRYFEMVPSRDDKYQAVEISKPVDQLIPSGVDLVATSKDSSFLAFAVKGTDEVFVYRYYTDGERRRQSAWFRWDMHGEIIYHFMIGDAYYIVTNQPTGVGDETIVNLQRLNLVIDKGQALINIDGPGMNEDYDYQIHLDGYFMVIPSEMSYNQETNTTSFRLPIGYHGAGECVAYEVRQDDHNADTIVQSGRTGVVTLAGQVDNVQGTVSGDWTTQNLITGFPFVMSLTLPTFYPSQSNPASNYVVKDTRGYLTIHRVQLEFQNLGLIQAKVNRRGREPFDMTFSSTPADYYTSGTTAIELNQQRILPIYDKNENVEITIHGTSPEPVTLISASWEGDYSDRNYRRV